MKRITTLFLTLLSVTIFAQCEISGKNTLFIGETSTYSIGNEVSQCKQCHQWNSQGNATINSDNRLNSVNVNALSAGKATLFLQYFSHQSLVSCSKDILIVERKNQNTTQNNPSNDSDCDISFFNFKEVKINENNIALFPDTQQDLKFKWEVNYKNGDTKTFDEKVPQVPFYKENPIVNVKIQVFSKTCYKKFTKTYEGMFWEQLK